jgi:hypothetical protein
MAKPKPKVICRVCQLGREHYKDGCCERCYHDRPPRPRKCLWWRTGPRK